MYASFRETNLDVVLCTLFLLCYLLVVSLYHMKPLFLIADDSPGKRELLKRIILRNMNAEILEASTTEEAQDLIGEHVEFAAAFVDYEIPSENGPSVIRTLKKHNPACLIALVSSADSEVYKQKAKNAGADACICTSWPLNRVESELNLLLAGWGAEISD